MKTVVALKKPLPQEGGLTFPLSRHLQLRLLIHLDQTCPCSSHCPWSSFSPGLTDIEWSSLLIALTVKAWTDFSLHSLCGSRCSSLLYILQRNHTAPALSTLWLLCIQLPISNQSILLLILNLLKNDTLNVTSYNIENFFCRSWGWCEEWWG